MERAFCILGRACSFNGVNTTHLRGPLDEEMLNKGLAWVQRRHALLNVRIFEPRGAPPFFDPRGAPPIALQVVSRRGAEDWKAVEHDLINRPFGPEEGLCRAVWLRGEDGGESELLISHHHVIADAQSAVIMARDLLCALDRLSRREELPPPPPPALAPPFEVLLRPALPFLRRFGYMTRFFFHDLWRRLVLRPRKLLLDQTAPFQERSLRVIHLRLQPDEVRAICQAARERGTTMQGALGAALLRSCAGEVGQGRGQAQGMARLGFFSTVGMRDYIDPGLADAMGLYVSQVATVHRVSRGTPFWELARDVRERLLKTLRGGEQFITLPMLGMFVRRGDELRDRLARSFDFASPAAIGVSNIGRVELPRRAGPLVVRGFELAVGPSVVSPLVAAASTFEDGLALNLVSVEPLLSGARAERIGQAALEELRGAAGSG